MVFVFIFTKWIQQLDINQQRTDDVMNVWHHHRYFFMIRSVEKLAIAKAKKETKNYKNWCSTSNSLQTKTTWPTTWPTTWLAMSRALALARIKIMKFCCDQSILMSTSILTSWGLRIPGIDLWIRRFSSSALRRACSLSSRNKSEVSSPANSLIWMRKSRRWPLNPGISSFKLKSPLTKILIWALKKKMIKIKRWRS